MTCPGYATVHVSHFLQGSRKTRPCLTGHPVSREVEAEKNMRSPLAVGKSPLAAGKSPSAARRSPMAPLGIQRWLFLFIIIWLRVVRCGLAASTVIGFWNRLILKCPGCQKGRHERAYWRKRDWIKYLLQNLLFSQFYVVYPLIIIIYSNFTGKLFFLHRVPETKICYVVIIGLNF